MEVIVSRTRRWGIGHICAVSHANAMSFHILHSGLTFNKLPTILIKKKSHQWSIIILYENENRLLCAVLLGLSVENGNELSQWQLYNQRNRHKSPCSSAVEREEWEEGGCASGTRFFSKKSNISWKSNFRQKSVSLFPLGTSRYSVPHQSVVAGGIEVKCDKP